MWSFFLAVSGLLLAAEPVRYIHQHSASLLIARSAPAAEVGLERTVAASCTVDAVSMSSHPRAELRSLMLSARVSSWVPAKGY